MDWNAKIRNAMCQGLKSVQGGGGQCVKKIFKSTGFGLRGGGEGSFLSCSFDFLERSLNMEKTPVYTLKLVDTEICNRT